MIKFIQQLMGIWGYAKPEAVQMVIEEDSMELPVVGGRQSVQSLQAQMGVFSIETDAGFDLNLLKVLENLAISDRYISKAVNNIVTLSDSKETITFDNTVSPANADKMQAHLTNVSRNWYMNSEGASLNSALYSQIAIYGCLSVEYEGMENRKGIKKVHLVNPVEIRFGTYDKDMANWPAYQLPNRSYSPSGTGGFMGIIPLNGNQYTYMALNRKDGSPYAIPPFIPAINDIFLHNEIVGGFSQVMKMVGMLGFLEVNVVPPKQDKSRGESDTQYQARCAAYLDSLEPQIRKGIANGFAVGFKDTHEFNLQSAPTNAANIEPMVNFVKKLIFEGIKQDPNFHGENMTITETFGRVLLAIMAKDIEVYQGMVKAFKEKLYMTELRLAGFKPVSLTVSFDKAIAGDKELHEKTEQIKIDNVFKKYEMGIISQGQAAKELGYDMPNMPEPRVHPTINTSHTQNTLDGLFFLNGGGKTLFDYGKLHESACSHEHFAAFGDKMQGFISDYGNALNKLFKSAISEIAKGIRNRLEGIQGNGGTATDQLLSQIIFTEMLFNWQRLFVEPSKKITEANLPLIYQFYRKSKTGFQFSTGQFRDIDIPDATFDLKDVKAMNWLDEVDNFYLGKFITDPDTMARVRKFNAEFYLNEGLPIGRDSPVIDKFIEAFEDLIYLERWKIRRIIETSINNARNFAQTMYISQAGLEKYERVEVGDRLTCPYCKAINGKEFSVQKNVQNIEKITSSQASDLPTISPFATTLKIDDWEKLTPADIQSKGMAIGSLHPHCRGRWVAVI